MINLQNVSKIFDNNGMKTTALNNISLTIKPGEIFGVIGLSGAGKSTLIRTINYLEKPTEGKVLINGQNLGVLSVKQLRSLRKDIGMIFQHFNLVQSKTIYQNIAIPLILNKEKKTTIDVRVKELLSFVGLEDKAENYPNELSGGQKQRVGIARALATNPSILLCDEATSALDPETTKSILQLLKKINEQYNITIVMITHEMEIIKEICHRVAVMNEGAVVESGEVERVFIQPQHEMTRKFVGDQTRDEIPTVVREKMATIKAGRIVKVNYSPETMRVLNRLIKDEQIIIDFLYSFVHEHNQLETSYTLIHVKGKAEDVNDVLLQLQNKNLIIKEVV